MNLFAFVLIGLAVWRFSSAIAKENGPYMAFARLRARLAHSQKRSGGLYDMVSCVKCLSMWVGLIASLWLSSGVISWLIHGFAFSAVAVIIEQLLKKS